MRQLLEGMSLEAFPVTSGSTGVHVYAPLDGSATSQEISDMAHELARSLEADHTTLIVSAMKKTVRENKVFIDWSQNSAAKTTVAPYSLRGCFTPTIAAPRTWDELDDPTAVPQLRFEEVVDRISEFGDLLAPLTESTGGTRSEPKFVIQEHLASSLHGDSRREHDGVLLSWALPKGPPSDPVKNHLAVAAEDKPLEYASFEGMISKGQHGAGKDKIGDAGTCQLEKWREGEAIVVLQSRTGGGLRGMRRFALFNTGESGPNEIPEKNRMIHLFTGASGGSP